MCQEANACREHIQAKNLNNNTNNNNASNRIKCNCILPYIIKTTSKSRALNSGL